MEDVNQSGPNEKKRRRRSKANTANQEDPNAPELDKDEKLRDRRNKCWIEVENLICDVLDGDSSIRTTGTWEGRKKKVKEANERLQDPLVILGKLRKLIAPSIMGNTGVETALQEVESFFKPSQNPVTNQEYTDGIHGMVKKLKDTKKELQLCANQLKQDTIICDHKKQSMTEAKAFGEVSQMLSKVSESCCGKMSDILNLANPVQGHFVQIEDEQLVLHLDDSGMVDLEEPEKEVHLTLAFAGERLAKLTLKMQNNDREMILPTLSNAQVPNHMGAPLDSENPSDLVRHTDWGEGTSNSRANEANTEMPCVVTSGTRSYYSIKPSNFKVLTEIVEKHPVFDKNFLLQLPYFQCVFMDSLAQIYHSIEIDAEKYELDDIIIVETMVKDMELTGLEVSWVKKKLAPVREMLRSRLQGELDSIKAKENETKQKLAMLK